MISDIKKRIPIKSAAIHLPIGFESSFAGVVDVITMKAHYYEGNWGMNMTENDIPESLKEKALDTQEKLYEALADVDDEFAEKYLGGEAITPDLVKKTIRKNVIALKFAPILLGSAYKNKGIQNALNAVGEYLPLPEEVTNEALDLSKGEEQVNLECHPKKPLVLLAFKLEDSRFGQLTYIRVYQGKLKRGDYVINSSTQKRVKINRMVRMHSNEMVEIQEASAGDICALFGVECTTGDTFTDGSVNYSMTSMYVPDPVMSLSIRATKKDYTDKFQKALVKFQKEDPTFKVRVDEESEETIISGMGELHLQIYAERMRREYNIEVELGPPSVNYREIISKRAYFNYLHKKQTGGAGQFAGVEGYIEPIPELKPGEFVPSKFCLLYTSPSPRDS